jgi:hypothetical protein
MGAGAGMALGDPTTGVGVSLAEIRAVEAVGGLGRRSGAGTAGMLAEGAFRAASIQDMLLSCAWARALQDMPASNAAAIRNPALNDTAPCPLIWRNTPLSAMPPEQDDGITNCRAANPDRDLRPAA